MSSVMCDDLANLCFLRSLWRLQSTKYFVSCRLPPILAINCGGVTAHEKAYWAKGSHKDGVSYVWLLNFFQLHVPLRFLKGMKTKFFLRLLGNSIKI